MQPPSVTAANSSAGVRAILAALSERRRKTRIDRDVAEEVYKVFEAIPNSRVKGLHFYVFEGTVSIYGAVPTHSERDAVIAALSSVKGIERLADHMTVFTP